jgi:hypothetical protein
VTRMLDFSFMSLNQIPFTNYFSHDVLSSLVKRTKYTYVLPLLEDCHFAI